MKKADSTTSEVHFEANARLLRMLGEELIPDETVAVVELVKNAWDADAKRVTIAIDTASTPPRIVIDDDGHGMSFDTLTNVWMQPGTPSKRDPNRRTSPRGRLLLGKKGVGRFATDKLARQLQIRTKVEGEPVASTVAFDYGLFDDDSKLLGDLRFTARQEHDDVAHKGTTLTLTDLRTSWNDARIEGLRRDLLRLQSPFSTGNEAFSVILKVNGREEDLARTRDELFDRATVKIHARYRDPLAAELGVDEKPLNVAMIVRGKTTDVPWDDPSVRGAIVGSFEVTLRVWLLDEGGLQTMREELKLSTAEARKQLAEWSGVAVYRDGFRVYPYGLEGNDWLGLDKRRINNPTEHVGNRQVVGAVMISDKTNPALRDQTNRLGLIENEAFKNLKRVVLAVVQIAEGALRKVREDRGGRRPSRVRRRNAALRTLRERIVGQEELPKPEELVDLVDEAVKEEERFEEEVVEEIARYRRMLSLGAIAARMIHEVGQQVDIARRRAHTVHNLLKRNPPPIGDIRDSLGVADQAMETVARKVNDLLPFARSKREEEVLVVKDVLRRVFEQEGERIKKAGVKTLVDGDESRVRVDLGELFQVFHNLLDNSLYWLQGRSAPGIDARVRAEGATVEVLFTDNGPGIQHPEPESIMDPFVTTKPGGMGLGLAIAGEILEGLGGTLRALRTDAKSGCTIKVTLPRVTE